MDLTDLERPELVRLAELLSRRLGTSITNEIVLELRVSGLVTALDARERDDDPAWEKLVDDYERAKGKVEELSLEVLGWKEAAEHAEGQMWTARKELNDARADLQLAKDQWREHTKQTSDEIDCLKQEIKDSAVLHTADIEVISNLRLTLEDQRTCLAARDMDVRRLERELRENRATVMNEVSAMIPKAVEAEREACMALLRDAALKCADVTNTNALMGLVNIIKARGGKK